MGSLPKTRYFSIQEAAKYLGVSTKTLRRWEGSKTLTALRTQGGHRRYSISDLTEIRNKKKDNKNRIVAKDIVSQLKAPQKPVLEKTYNYSNVDLYKSFQFHPEQKKVLKIIAYSFFSFLFLAFVYRTGGNLRPDVEGYITKLPLPGIAKSIINSKEETYSTTLQASDNEANAKVLAASTTSPVFNVNILSAFNDVADFVKGLTSKDVATSTLEATGAAKLASTLDVTGLSTFQNNVSVAGDFVSPSTTFNILPTTVTTLNLGLASTNTSISATTGTTTVNNTLNVKGALNSSAKITGSGDLSISGASALNGAVTAGSSLTVSGATTLSSTLDVAGNSTFGNITKVNGITYSFPTAGAAGANYVLSSDTSGNLTWESISSSGGITGSGTVNFIPKFSSAGTITNSLLSDTGSTLGYNSNFTVSSAGGVTATGLTLNLGSDATGDIYYRNSSGNIARLGIGSANQVLTVNSGIPAWIGGSGTGSEGFWARSGTTLSPVNSGDAVTSSGLLTASNGFTLSTGALNLTSTSGTSSLTSTANSGSSFAFANTSLNTNNANLTAFSFTNTSSSGSVITNGLNISATGTATSGTNTNNLVNLSATAGASNNTFNGINFGSNLQNYVNGSNWVVTAAGAENLGSSLTSVGVNSQSGLIQGTGGITVTGAANINATGTANTSIGNSSGTFQIASTGLNLTTAGALTGVATLDTITTDATHLTFAGAGTLDSTGSNNLNIGTGGTAKTISIGTGVSGNTINIGASSSTTVTFAGIASGTGNALCLSGTTLVTCTVGSGGISGSGSSGQVSFFNSASSIAGTNNFFWDSTNNRLGIGLNAPTSPLTVKATDGGNAAAVFDQRNSADIIAASQSGTTKFRLDSSGNLLIAASDKLDTLTAGTLNIGTSTANAIALGNSGATVSLTLGSDATGDTYYRNSSGNLVRLGVGTNGQVLTSNGTIPSWVGGTGGTGSDGFWTRSGTTLSPVNSGDNVTTSGNISTSGSGTITSAATLTASNAFTLTTGQLNLTATGGSSSFTGYGTFSDTSTVNQGNVFSINNSSFTTPSADAVLLNLAFTNGSTNTSGTKNTIGIDISPTNNAVGSGGTQDTYGVKVEPIAGTSGAGTQDNYGIRIGNQGLASTENSYGLYVDNQTGSTTSYAAVFAGGQVGIDKTNPSSTLDVTGTGAFSSTLTASNGFTLTTGALNLTSTSGATSLTSTATSGTSFQFTNGHLNNDGAGLSAFNFVNAGASSGTATVNGISVVSSGTSTTGTNTENLLNLSATALSNNTFNGINFGSGLTNYVNATNWTVTASGAETLASTLTVQGTTVSVGNGSAATINTPSSNANLTIAPNGSGTLNLGTSNTGAISVGNGTGTISLTLGSDATGDTYYRDSSGHFVRLGIGSSGQVLTTSGSGIPSWVGGTGTGSTGFWTRSGTTLSPSNANDIASISSNSSTALLTLSPTGATGTGLAIGALSGSTANTGISIGNITAAATATNFGISTGTITPQASTTSYGINIGNTLAGAGTETGGLKIGTNASTATTNYGINLGAISGAGTTNYGLFVGSVSGSTSNYGIFFNNAPGSGSIAAANNTNIGITTSGTGSQIFTSGATTGTGTSGAYVFNASALNSGDMIYATASAITSGNILKLGQGGNTNFTGNVIAADIDKTGQGGIGFTGNFELYKNANTTEYQVDSTGDVLIAAASRLDTIAAGTLNIGTSTANNVTLGNGTTSTQLNFTSGTGAQTFTSSVASGTTTSSSFVYNDTALTSGTLSYFTSNHITTGKLVDIADSNNTWTGNGTTNGLINLSSSSTAGAASASNILLNLSRSGSNTNSSVTSYGLYSNVTNSGTTSTNVGGYFSASGATNNYGLIVNSGNVGIGTTSPGTPLAITYTDSATSTSTNISTFVHNSSGTTAAGFGTGMLFRMQNASGTVVDADSIVSNWRLAGAGVESGNLSFYTNNNGNGLTEKLRLTSAGGFFVGSDTFTNSNLNNANLVNINGITEIYTTSSGSTAPDALVIANLATSGDAANIGSTIHFQSMNANTNTRDQAKIASFFSTATQGSERGVLTFSTAKPNDSNSTTIAEAMRIDGNQRVGIGTTSPTALFHVSDTGTTTGNSVIATASAITSGNLLTLGEGGDQTFSGNGLLMDFDNTGGGGKAFTGNFLQLNNAGTNKLNITSTGTINLASGDNVDTIAAGTLNIANSNATTLALGSPSLTTFSLTVNGGFNVSTGGTITIPQNANVLSGGTVHVSGTLANQSGGTCGTLTNDTTHAYFVSGTAPTTSDGFYNSTRTKHAIISSVANCSNGSSQTVQEVTLSTSITSQATGDSFTVYQNVPNIGNATSQFFYQIYGLQIIGVTSSLSGGFDLAEEYPTQDATIEAGDVVSFIKNPGDGTNISNVAKSNVPYDSKLFGVVSSNPGLTFGNETNGQWRKVALSGRVKVKIASDSAAISIGDPLTSSTTDGKAMKATRAGFIIGRAIEDYDATSGTVTMIVEPGYYDPNAGSTLTDSQPTATDSASFDLSLLKSAFTASGSAVIAKVSELDTTKLNVLGDTVLGDTVVNGKLNVGTLTFDNTNQSINAIGVLKIQNLALGNVEFMNGLITFDTNGNVIAKSITADKYKVAGTSAGTATITAGQTTTTINTNSVTASSLIFVTAQTATNKTLAVTAKTNGTSFNVEIPSPDTKDIQFNWWIVDKQ